MDAVIFVTVLAIIIFGLLSIWSLYIKRRDPKNRLVDVSFVITFASLWGVLCLLVLGVQVYVAYSLVIIVVAVSARLRRRSWMRMLDKYKR